LITGATYSDYSEVCDCFSPLDAIESDLYLSVFGAPAAPPAKLNSFMKPLSSEFSLMGTLGFGGS